MTTTEITESKKEILSTHSEGKKVRENKKKNEIVRNEYNGELIKEVENFYEKVQMYSENQNGEITMNKKKVREGSIETLEEEDNGENTLSELQIEDEFSDD